MASSRTRSRLNAMVLAPEEHGTLEVDHNHWLENDANAAPMASQNPMNGKIVIDSDADKIALVKQDPGDGKIVVDNDDGKEAVVTEGPNVHLEISDSSESLRPIEERKIFGLKRKTFFILSLVIIVMIASTISGGVGGTIAARNRKQTDIPIPSSTSPQAPTTTRAYYANTGLAAIQWTDLNGTMQKRLYYQDKNDIIRESAWNNSTAFTIAWEVNTVDYAKPGTPIAAAPGYPWVLYKNKLVKNLYYMATNNQLIERAAPSDDPQQWDYKKFTGLHTGINSTFLTAYWNENIQRASEELIVLFQDKGSANRITQGRWITKNSTVYESWTSQIFGFSQPRGSTFAMSVVDYQSGKNLMLYTVDDTKHLQQHQYTINDTDPDNSIVFLTSESATGLTVEPRSPLAVVAQDNQPLYAPGTLPECARNLPLTHLIIFAVPDRSSLVLSAWNCTAGLVNHTSEIEPLQKANTTYLSLAAMNDKETGDGNVYIMFDSGNGPQIEEWTVPKRAGDAWVMNRNVTIDLGL